MTYINDAVYGYITIPDYVQAVIDTPVFQRLKYVRQTGSLYQVWPCANHTRFEHSVGCMHLAREYLIQHLGWSEHRPFVLACLLHDIGHGPMSHVFERAIKGTPLEDVYQDHDVYRYRLLDENTELSAAISAEDRQAIKDIWRGTSRVFHTLLAGPFGVDRMDYLVRDSLYTKPVVTLLPTCIQRIMRETTVADGRVYLSAKGIGTVKHLLDVRFDLYDEVYMHKTAFAADSYILQLFQQPDFIKCVQNMLDPNEFTHLDDGFIMSQPFMRDLKCRRLPKYTRKKVGDDTDVMIAIRYMDEGDFDFVNDGVCPFDQKTLSLYYAPITTYAPRNE